MGISTEKYEAKPSTLQIWILASRPHTLTASISPVLVGYTLCKTHYNHFLEDDSTTTTTTTNNHNMLLLELTLQWMLFCILVQLGTNLHNDYADFVKGADTDKRVGQARATQKGWLTPEQTCRGSSICLILAFGIGISLAQQQQSPDWWMMFIVLTSVFNAVAYTGGPYPLGYIGLSNVSIAYSGLGDIFAFLYFGLVATLTLPYLLLRNSSKIQDFSNMKAIWTELKFALLIALPVGFLATAIIVVNNLRDRETDIHAKKQTLAVRYGETFCRIEYALLVIGSYICALLSALVPEKDCVVRGYYYYFKCLPFLSIFVAIPQLRAVSFGGKDFAQLNPHVGGTARLQLLFCLLLCASLQLTNE